MVSAKINLAAPQHHDSGQPSDVRSMLSPAASEFGIFPPLTGLRGFRRLGNGDTYSV
jgi:hypothetical protein